MPISQVLLIKYVHVGEAKISMNIVPLQCSRDAIVQEFESSKAAEKRTCPCFQHQPANINLPNRQLKRDRQISNPYMKKRTFVAETTIWAKKNLQKIWPKNGLKWPKIT